MFQTLTGSLVVLFAVVGIIFVFALFMTGVLRWLFLTDADAGTTTMYAPSAEYGFRKAA
jgi:type IV secretory pathway VirB2 component (pilin)